MARQWYPVALMALRELVDLRQDAAALCADLAQLALATVRGTPFPQSLPHVVRVHRLACSRDGLAQAVEALGRAAGPARISRLSSLRDLLVRARSLALDPAAAQELLDFPRRPSVQLHGDPGLHGALPPVAVERDLPTVRTREERADMEHALAQAERESSGARSVVWEAAQAALSELGAGDPADAALALHERGWAVPEANGAPKRGPDEPVATSAAQGADSPLVRAAVPPEPESDPATHACERFLRETDALARDLGGWLLERDTGSQPAPGGAERHDLLRFLYAPRCAGAFPRGELLRTLRRWAEMLRLDLTAGGTIGIDQEERPLQPGGAHAVAADPPHDVQVVVRAAEGPYALASLLGAVGRAQLRAAPPPDAPPEDVWLGDAALEPACGFLFSGLLLDATWLRRCARAELPRDDERALAVAALLETRLCAARVLASLEAHRSGLGARAEEAYRELHARAALAEIPSALAARDLDPWLAAWGEVRGRSLAAAMRDFLRERFDEDWWRNPRSLTSLNALWSRGGRPTAAELWHEISRQPSVDPLIVELSRACA
jgi:hypothetical protein